MKWGPPFGLNSFSDSLTRLIVAELECVRCWMWATYINEDLMKTFLFYFALLVLKIQNSGNLAHKFVDTR